MADECDDVTDPDIRSKYTNDIIAIIVICAPLSWTSYFIGKGILIPQWLIIIDTLCIITVIVWAFGKERFSIALDYIFEDKE